jgi:acetyltransferase-like isoleucine patch superfamily enzyme
MLEQRVILDAKTQHADGITLGDCVAIRTGTLIDTGYCGSVTVGAGSTLGAFCELRGSGHLRIGSNCLLARNVMIETSEHSMEDPTIPITEQGVLARPTVVQDGVWIGANVLIRNGITIGDDAVIGANAVVTRNVPPGAIVAGVPARVLRFRRGFGG